MKYYKIIYGVFSQVKMDYSENNCIFRNAILL